MIVFAKAMLNIMQSYCCYQKQSMHKHTEPFSPSINYVVTLPYLTFEITDIP